jgi:Transposase DDE domain
MKMKASENRTQVASEFLNRIFGDDIHAKRIESLANGVVGVMASVSLAVSLIGQALAQARSLNPKHAVKQVDRLLSNSKIVVWAMFAIWVAEIVGKRISVVIAMDWTDFDADNQSTLSLNMITNHGRATPLLWLTVDKDELKDRRNDFEDLCLSRLREVMPKHINVTILADRGFGDVKLFEFIRSLGFHYVIRIRGNIYVTAADGEKRLAADWVGKGGRARMLRGARVTASNYQAAAVVCVHAKNMKEGWCIVSSNPDQTTRQIINYYAKRWTIEPNFRDTKDLRFGMGLNEVRISNPERRDRLLLLNAFAIVLLTMLGAAGEQLGYDRMLKSNTSKHRTHSLFRQGCMLYDLIPTMAEAKLRPLMERFQQIIDESPTISTTFGVV